MDLQNFSSSNDITDKNNFLLTSDEIKQSRLGVERNVISKYTESGNSVDVLINGDHFFSSLYKNLEATKKDDFIWMTDWDIDPDVMLLPDPDDKSKSEQSTILAVLLRAISRGVKVLILLNRNCYNPIMAMKFAYPLNSAAGYTVCAPDSRHNSFFGNLHQKAWVIKRNNETIAYVGSMDISSGRYDTRQHDQNAAWKMEPSFPQNYAGWTGGMLEIKGPAVIDIARHLHDEFSDPVKPAQYYRLDNVPAWSEPPVGKYDTSTTIQVLLTAGQAGAINYGYYSNWAPKGEMSILSATLKAIHAAKDYIFLSDQFLWYPKIIDALAEKIDDVKSIILLTDNYKTLEHKILGYNITFISNAKAYYQYQALKVLKEKDPDNKKVHLYQTIKEGSPDDSECNVIYNHWKVMIIDDEFSLIGTAGIETSGMTNDIDMSLGIYDKKLTPVIRKKLWAEYLNCEESDARLEDPIKAVDSLWQKSAATKGRVREYWPPEIPFYKVYEYIYGIFEPDGELKSESSSALLELEQFTEMLSEHFARKVLDETANK